MKKFILFSLIWTLLLGCDGRPTSEDIAGIYTGETTICLRNLLNLTKEISLS